MAITLIFIGMNYAGFGQLCIFVQKAKCQTWLKIPQINGLNSVTLLSIKDLNELNSNELKQNMFLYTTFPPLLQQLRSKTQREIGKNAKQRPDSYFIISVSIYPL